MSKININDYIGKKFGQLTVLSECNPINKHTSFLVKCDCGVELKLDTYRLVSGHTSSCGCLRRKVCAQKVTTHSLSRHPIYRIWGNMIQRCYDTNSNRYYVYGGKGIKICKEWRNDFKSFYHWMILNNWKKGLQIDRIDNDGNYEPDNCRIVSMKENMNNRSDNRVFILNGERFTMTQLSEINNIKVGTLWYRLSKGMDIEIALKNPIKIKKPLSEMVA